MSTLDPFFGAQDLPPYLIPHQTSRWHPCCTPKIVYIGIVYIYHSVIAKIGAAHFQTTMWSCRILASTRYWCTLCCVDSAVAIRLWRFGCIDWSADLTVVIRTLIQLRQYLFGLRRFVCCMIAWLFGCYDATANSYVDCWIDSAAAICMLFGLRRFVCCAGLPICHILIDECWLIYWWSSSWLLLQI